MLFREFADYLARLEKTSSRIEITKILFELFKSSPANEIQNAVYLSLGILAPNYEGVLLNLAEKMMLKVLSLSYGVSIDEVRILYKKDGDVGDVAQKLSQKREAGAKELTVLEVYEKLREIAQDSGEGSQERKIFKFAELLKWLDPLSAKYVARIPLGRLRLGFSEKTVIAALAVGDRKRDRDRDREKEIERAYNIRPDIGYIAKLVKEGNLKIVKPAVGVPVAPMLAARLNSPTEMIKKMGKVSVEPKFDGLRIFIHFKRPDYLRVFTRNMNTLDSHIFPELTDVGKFIKADSVILDTEAVGLDAERESFVDFQKTIQRRRKHDVAESSEKTPLQFQVFDILLKDDESLIEKPYLERRRILLKTVVDGELLRVDENVVTDDPEVIRSKHKQYLKQGLEGVVVKKADAAYVSGRSGWNWVKMKEEEGRSGRLSDTIDCVVMGYTVGKGKRAGFGVGQFLVGVRDGDRVKTTSKIGTGLTDEQFAELRKRLKKVQVKSKPKEYEVHKSYIPDFWVTPFLVVEIAADEITVSPKHTAGLALRFPRLVKFRDDKNADQITTLEELKEIYGLQKK